MCSKFHVNTVKIKKLFRKNRGGGVGSDPPPPWRWRVKYMICLTVGGSQYQSAAQVTCVGETWFALACIAMSLLTHPAVCTLPSCQFLPPEAVWLASGHVLVGRLLKCRWNGFTLACVKVVCAPWRKGTPGRHHTLHCNQTNVTCDVISNVMSNENGPPHIFTCTLRTSCFWWCQKWTRNAKKKVLFVSRHPGSSKFNQVQLESNKQVCWLHTWISKVFFCLISNQTFILGTNIDWDEVMPLIIFNDHWPDITSKWDINFWRVKNVVTKSQKVLKS